MVGFDLLPVLGGGVSPTPGTRWWGLTYSQYSVVGVDLLPVLGGGVDPVGRAVGRVVRPCGGALRAVGRVPRVPAPVPRQAGRE